MTPFALLLLLAALQGLTEFLPVSSSGHLVMARLLLPGGDGLPDDASVEVLLHLGTLFAVVVFYRSEIAAMFTGLLGGGSGPRKQQRLAFLLVIASVPAGLVGFFLEQQINAAFAGIGITAICLLVTGFILWSSPRRSGRLQLLEIGVGAAVLIGCVQAAAILPGISRSGTTIVCGLWLGLSLETAASFSFLLSIPAIAGAACLKIPAMLASPDSIPDGLLLATVISFVTGLFALTLLLKIAHARGISSFAPYCWLLGLFGLVLNYG